MKSSISPLRQRAINIYNQSPIYCLNCNKKIEVSETERPADTRKKKFCNHSCAASYNNIGISRNKSEDLSKVCECGRKKRKKAKTCSKCYISRITVKDKPLSFFLKNGKYSTIALSHFRKLAKDSLEKSTKEKVCIVCKDKALEPILQVCHIKGIMTFDKGTKIGVINNINNLEWMCPNHHALYDKGLIKMVTGSA